jgi:hypothetical protein
MVGSRGHSRDNQPMAQSATGRVAELGTGWQELVSELRKRLVALDPGAELSSVTLDEYGLVRLRARVAPQARAQAERLVREYETRMLRECELCGGGGRIFAGAVLSVLCEDCAAATH